MPRILITGICGFVGRALAEALTEFSAPNTLEIFGFDNFSRPGSFSNLDSLQKMGVRVCHGDVRCASDFSAFEKIDWVIDAAANPSVLAGLNSASSSRQVMENNLLGTLNILEFCKSRQAGMILLSSSRVYSIPGLRSIGLEETDGAFHPAPAQKLANVSEQGITEGFSSAAPVSLYGASKLASEVVALDYMSAFQFPVWINRCGVLAGAGQFGKADQGIVSYWIHGWRRGIPLRYIGFGGRGLQARDCFHPRDLARVILAQMASPDLRGERIFNLSGGRDSAFSLAQLSRWCAVRFGDRQIASELAERPADLPWVVLDSARARQRWNWRPEISREALFEEIAGHAEKNPRWLEISGAI
jgi:CDP-paratose 2-epimerase